MSNEVTVKTAPAVESGSTRIYNRVSRMDIACRVLFCTLAFVFVAIHPKGNFPTEVPVMMVVLGVIAALVASIRFGMRLENPARE